MGGGNPDIRLATRIPFYLRNSRQLHTTHEAVEREKGVNVPRNLPAIADASEVIIRVRGQAVILDSDLATLYCVETKRLNQQVSRNQERFPKDFVFQLTEREWKALRLQNATSKGRGGRRYPPYAYTEHGAVMAANVLKSNQAIQMSVAVVRAFVRLRRMTLSVEGLARKVEAMEKKYDKQFSAVFGAIRQLILEPEQPRKQIGFHADKK